MQSVTFIVTHFVK